MPLTLLVGERGLGKTMLVEALLADLGKTGKFSPCRINDPRGDAAVMLGELIKVFQPPTAIDDTLQALWTGVDKIRSAGSFPLVIVDDAHLLSNAGASILGKLATGDRARTRPVPVLLVGQPTTARRLNLPAFRLLKGASDGSIELQPLSQDEIGPYINSRLQRAGTSPDNGIFEPETFPLIADATAGVPRQINKLCEVCLFLAGESKVTSITAESLQQTLVIYNDMEIPGQDDGPPDNVAPSDFVVLQEPKRREQAEDDLQPPLPSPSPPVSSVVPRRGSPPAVKPAARGRGLGFAMAGLVVVAAIYVLSPLGPLPKESGIMVALYGKPPSTSPTERPLAATSGLDPVNADETAIMPLPVLQRAYDPIADPAAAYYERAIASTSSQEIAIAYSRAAIRGHARSALYLGQLFETGDGVVFAPEVAAQWYAVADNATLLETTVLPEGLGGGGAVEGLFSAVDDNRAELVWHGNATMFLLEIGDADGNPIAQFTTPLTAALLEIPPNAVLWRVKTNAEGTADWIPILTERAD